MAIAYVQGKAAQQASGTSLGATMTSAPVQNHVLIACCYVMSGASAPTAQSGWTMVVWSNDATTGHSSGMAIKTAGASESTTQTPFTVTSAAASVVIEEYSGVGTTLLHDSTGFFLFTSSASSQNLAYTNPHDNDMVVAFSGVNTSSDTPTTPSGFTARDSYTGSSSPNIAVWEKSIATASSSNTTISTAWSSAGFISNGYITLVPTGAQNLYLRSTQSTIVSSTTCRTLSTTQGSATTTGTSLKNAKTTGTWQFQPGSAITTLVAVSPGVDPKSTNLGFLFDGAAAGTYATGTWTFDLEVSDSSASGTAELWVNFFKVTVSGTTITTREYLTPNNPATSGQNTTTFTPATSAAVKTVSVTMPEIVLASSQYLYLEVFLQFTVAGSSTTGVFTLDLDDNGVNASCILTPAFTAISTTLPPAPSIIQQGTSSGLAASNSGSTTVTMPSPTTVGNCLVAVVSNTSDGTVSTPSQTGWTGVTVGAGTGDSTTGTGIATESFMQVVTSAASSYSISLDSARDYSVIIYEIINADNNELNWQADRSRSTSAVTSLSIPAHTPTQSNSLLLANFIVAASSASTSVSATSSGLVSTWTTPSGPAITTFAYQQSTSSLSSVSPTATLSTAETYISSEILIPAIGTFLTSSILDFGINTGNTDLTVTLPNGAPSSGDVLVAITSNRNTWVNRNTGWYILGQQAGPNYYDGSAAIRLCDGTDTATVTPFVITGTNFTNASVETAVWRLTGVDWGNVIISKGGTGSNVTPPSFTVPSINSQTNNTIGLLWAGTGGTVTCTVPTGWTADSNNTLQTANMFAHQTGIANATAESPVCTFTGGASNSATAIMVLVGAKLLTYSSVLSAALSFLGTLATSLGSSGNHYTQSLTAGLSYVGNHLKNTLAVLIAALNFSGAINKFLSRAMTAVESFTGIFKKTTGLPFTANLSFVGNFFKNPGKTILAGLSFIGNQAKRTVAVIPAALSYNGNLIKSTVRNLITATLGFTGSLFKGTGVPFSANLSFAGGISVLRVYLRSLTAGLSFAGAQTKLTIKNLLANSTFTSGIKKASSFIISAGASFSGTFNKLTSKNVQANLSFAGSLLKTYLKNLQANLASTGLALQKNINKAISAVVSFTGKQIKATVNVITAVLASIGVLQKSDSRSFTAGLNFSGSLTVLKIFLRILSANLSFAGSQIKTATKNVLANLTFTGTQKKATTNPVTGNISFTGTQVHAIQRAFQAVLSFTGSLSTASIHVYHQILTATLSFIGTFNKAVTVPNTANLSFTGTFNHNIQKVFSAVVGFTGNVIKSARTNISANLTDSAVFAKGISRAFLANLTFTGQSVTQRILHRILTASLSFVGAQQKSIQKSMLANQGFTGQISKSIGQILLAVLGFAATILAVHIGRLGHFTNLYLNTQLVTDIDLGTNISTVDILSTKFVTDILFATEIKNAFVLTTSIQDDLVLNFNF